MRRSMFDDKIYLTDGATGTALQAAGMPLGACMEQWVLANPDALKTLQTAYVEAGSRLLHAPTAQLNSRHMARFGVSGSLDAMAKELVALTREAAGNKALVLGTMAPTGLRPEPYGDGDEYEIMGLAAEQVRALENAEVDLFSLVDQRWLCETKLYLDAIRAISERPVIVSFTCDENGRTAEGLELGEAAEQLEGMSVAAFGINCLGDLDACVHILTEVREWTDLPLLLRPSAGVSVIENGKVCYSVEAEKLAGYVPAFNQLGVRLMGGCCGTNPSHIAALRAGLRML